MEECKQEESPQMEFRRKHELCSNQASVASAQQNIKSSSAHDKVINDQYKNKIFVVRKRPPKDHHFQQPTEKLVIVNLDEDDFS